MHIQVNNGGNKNIVISLAILLLMIITASAKDVYVDINHGEDTNPGTLQDPLQTIQKATDIMISGDICYIRAGVYRETLIPKTDQLTFRNYENEYVLITGLDVVTGWTPHQGNIWKAGFKRPAPPGSFKACMVFVNGRRMNWARFPNEDGNMLNNGDMSTVTVDLDSTLGPVYMGRVVFDDLPPAPQNTWAGAYFVGVADQRNWFTANKGLVKESSGKSLLVKDISWNWNNGFKFSAFLMGGFGYLIGHMQALDAETEWHLQNDTLYLYPPAGTDMNNALLEARSRTLGLNLSGRTGITVQGINFKAAGVKMEASVNCVIDSCSFRYASSFSAYNVNAWGDYKNGDGGIYISGNHNRVKNCYIGQTWGYGITMWGDHNRLENSLVEQCDWQAERMANVASPGDDNTIQWNTIRYGSREGIELGNTGWIGKYAKRALIQFNYVHHQGMLCPDGGLFYVNHQGGSQPVANTEISYNIWHDYPNAEMPRSHGGIYLDNMSSGYSIHHNVVWNVKSGIHMNDLDQVNNTHDVYIYHNTLINTQYGVRLNKGSLGSLYTHDVVVRNNHSNGGVFTGTDVDHNRTDLNDADFVEAASRNYRLKSTSASVNAGVILAGINDDAVDAPDLGAYELGGTDWSAGSNIEVPFFPDEVIRVTGLDISPDSLALTIGSSYQLSVSLRPAVVSNPGISWRSSDTLVAKTDVYGNVKAIAEGLTIITATTVDGGYTDTSRIIVTFLHCTGLSVSPDSLTLNVGEIYQLSASTIPSNASNQEVSWSSSDTMVAKVNSAGELTAIAEGSASITAKTVDGGYTDTCALTLTFVHCTGLRVSPDSINVYIGQPKQLAAGISPSNASNQRVSWSSGDTSIVRVDANGTLTATGAGSTCITARTDDGGYTDISSVTVLDGTTCPAFTRIEAENFDDMSGVLAGSASDIPYGAKVLTTDGDWCRYNNIDITCAFNIGARVACGSPGGSIEVRLDSISGTLIGTLAVENTGGWQEWMTVDHTMISSITGIYDVYLVFKGGTGNLINLNWLEFAINRIDVTGISLSPASASMLTGDTLQLDASLNPSDANNQDLKWTSSNANVATVKANGEVIARGAGSVTITVTSAEGGYTDESIISVSDFPLGLDQVIINSETYSLTDCIGAVVEIFDTIGKLLSRNVVHDDQYRLEMNALSNGFYVVRISNKGTVSTQKVFK